MYESDFFRMIDDHAGRLPTDELPAFFARLERTSLELDCPADAAILRRLAAWWLGDAEKAGECRPGTDWVTVPVCPHPSEPAAPPPASKRRQRKPRLASAIKQAHEAGQSVKGAAFYADHVELQFG